MGMAGWEDAKRRRSWLETKLPARGERVTAFLRIKPSCTGVMEMVEAPMSTTRAVGLPAAKLSFELAVTPGDANKWDNQRCEDAVPGKPEGRAAPIFDSYLDAFFSIFSRVPAGFGHEERVLAQGFFLLFHYFHHDVFVVRIIETVGSEWGRLRAREP